MKKLKLIYVGSFLFWIAVFLLVILSGDKQDPSIDNFAYLIKNHNYTDFFDIFNVLFHLEEFKINLFDWCCDFINFLGHTFGYNYQIINIIIFVLIFPCIFLNVLFISILQFLLLRKLNTYQNS
jgi:hypothetical protein